MTGRVSVVCVEYNLGTIERHIGNSTFVYCRMTVIVLKVLSLKLFPFIIIIIIIELF